MKLEFHSEMLRQQCYTCNCCGRGCRSFLVSVRQRERQAIEQQRDWRKALGVETLFIKTAKAKPFRYALAKRADGRCVFLNDENLCEIHRLYGLGAKPVACQIYPFVLTPFAGGLRVGLRFDCPAVCDGEGSALSGYLKEIGQLAGQIVPEGGAEVEPAAVWGRQKLSAEAFDGLNEAFIKIVNSDAMRMVDRLVWLKRFVDQIGRVKWNRVSAEEVGDFAAMLQGATLAELGREMVGRSEVGGRARKLLGHYLFILSHPTTIVHEKGAGLSRTLRDRLWKVSAMKRLGRTAGPLPKVQGDWGDVDLAVMERDFGRWPVEVEQMIGRYLTCRLGSMGYCGPMFYGYSMVEGVRALLLAMVTAGWLMRVYAASEGRDQLILSDAHRAVMAIDGNLGYSPALATGPDRWRIEYLNDSLEPLIVWYCS